MFWCSLVGADRSLKEAIPVAIACLEKEDLGFGVFCWERKVIRAEKIADGRVPLPARSGNWCDGSKLKTFSNRVDWANPRTP